MHPRGPLAVNQFPVDGKLENPASRRNELKGLDLVLVFSQQCPGNAESSFEVPSSRAVLQPDLHQGSSPPASWSFALPFYHIMRTGGRAYSRHFQKRLWAE